MLHKIRPRINQWQGHKNDRRSIYKSYSDICWSAQNLSSGHRDRKNMAWNFVYGYGLASGHSNTIWLKDIAAHWRMFLHILWRHTILLGKNVFSFYLTQNCNELRIANIMKRGDRVKRRRRNFSSLDKDTDHKEKWLVMLLLPRLVWEAPTKINILLSGASA